MEHCSDEELNTTIMVQIREVWNLNVISDTCAFRMCADTSLNINSTLFKYFLPLIYMMKTIMFIKSC